LDSGTGVELDRANQEPRGGGSTDSTEEANMDEDEKIKMQLTWLTPPRCPVLGIGMGRGKES